MSVIIIIIIIIIIIKNECHSNIIVDRLQGCRCSYGNSERYQKLQQMFEVQSFSLDTISYSLIALSTVRCSKPAQKIAVRVCQVATVVMATTQLVLRQFNTFSSRQLRTE